MTAGLLTRLASILAGRQPRRGPAVLVVAGLPVGWNACPGPRPTDGRGVVLVIGLSAVLCPLADAAISRRTEFAADRFAADDGLARELAAALNAIDDGPPAASGWSRRLLSARPPSGQRISALRTATASAHP